ncbi:hypothetical protein PsYK624_158900 [Phanerochaete sordida]|uniref:Uncharacterized protein n=1 Tax=Phanerochaete sordida TaxID=48140 RepID=A0A9P3GU75_9APHY|nr:hypothetical protein PsYK624_158900 [Phanerochaete sordida]
MAAQLQQAAHVVLAAAAPTLETLCMYGTSFDTVYHLFSFPVLRAMCIEVTFPFPDDGYATLPSLRRLHIRGWSDHTHYSPALTHLRVTEINKDRGVVDFIRKGFHMSVTDYRDNGLSFDPVDTNTISERQAGDAAKPLPKLQIVIVQPTKTPSGGICGSDRIANFQLKRELKDIARECADGAGTGRLYVLPSTTTLYTASEARLDWLDVVNGGNGPWATPEERAAMARARNTIVKHVNSVADGHPLQCFAICNSGYKAVCTK